MNKVRCAIYGLYQDLRASGPFWPIVVDPVHSKEERFNGCLGEVEAGHFLLPREAPWLEGFRHELKAFPMVKQDDQVDAFSQFVKYQLRKWPWILTEYEPDGRARRVVRHDKRPW